MKRISKAWLNICSKHLFQTRMFVVQVRDRRDRENVILQFCALFSILLAERFLESVESNQNYAILLLNLVGKEDLDSTIRVAGSIAFKNFVKRNWGTVSHKFPAQTSFSVARPNDLITFIFCGCLPFSFSSSFS